MSRASWMTLLAAMIASACSSGQTGSPSCAMPCECEHLVLYHLARATVTAVSDNRVTVRVEELLNAAREKEQFEGREVSGVLDQRSCNSEVLDVPTLGAEVFAAFNTDGSGNSDAGTPQAALHLQPWAEDVRLGDGSRVSRAEAVQLSDGSCVLRYGRECNDISEREGGCSLLSNQQERKGRGTFNVTLLLACLVLWRRRRACIRG